MLKKKRGKAISLADFQKTPSNQPPQPTSNAWDTGSVKIKDSAGGYIPPKKEQSKFNRNYDTVQPTPIKPDNPQIAYSPQVKSSKKSSKNLIPQQLAICSFVLVNFTNLDYFFFRKSKIERRGTVWIRV